MRLKQYLKEESVAFSKPKEHKWKEISVTGKDVIVTTENPNPTAVSGVRRGISRKKYKDEETAKKTFDKMVATALKKGWLKR